MAPGGGDGIPIDTDDMIAATPDVPPTHTPAPTGRQRLRTDPGLLRPGAGDVVLGDTRDAEIDALQHRISQLEALVERDEEVLRKVLSLLVEKGIATREEILERLR